MRVPASCLVYTPPSLADAMVQALEPQPRDIWLEPCVGTGALLKALGRAGVGRNNITGIDLKLTREPSDRLGKVQRGIEFLKWSQSTTQQFDKVVANPPYLAIERVQKSIKRVACKISVFDVVNVTASGNMWFAFLCAALNLLRPNGSLCFLLPASWDFADYARPLRESISRHFEGVEVYRSARPLFEFDGIQDGAVILIARNFALAGANWQATTTLPSHIRCHAASEKDIIDGLFNKKSRPKDSICAPPRTLPIPSIIGDRETRPLGEMVSIGIGGVTGDAEFFLLNEDKRRWLNLPVSSVRPIVSRARHLTSAVINSLSWNQA